MELAIRCTYPACPCSCFLPSESQPRVCQGCKHGWVAHVLDKLTSGCGVSGAYGLPQLCLNVVEPVSASAVFDVASLVLYGSQAVPIRLKILLDRLLGALAAATAATSAASLGAAACDDQKASEGSSSASSVAAAAAAAEATVVTLRVLHDLGWSYEDYIRGYVLQDLNGKSLDKWTVMNRDEEYIALQQFSRFAETRTLAQEMLLQEARATEELCPRQKKTESDIRKFIERSNLAIVQSHGLALERGAMPLQAAASLTATSRPVPDAALLGGIEFLQAAHRLALRPTTGTAGTVTAAPAAPTTSRGALAAGGGSVRECAGDQGGDRAHDAPAGKSSVPLPPPPRTCSGSSGGANDASGPASSSAHALGLFSAVATVQASGDCPSARSASASSPLSNRSGSTASENRLEGGEDGRGVKEWDEQQQRRRGLAVDPAAGSSVMRDDIGDGHFAGRSGAGGRANGVASALRPLTSAVPSWLDGSGSTRQSARSRRSSSGGGWGVPALAALSSGGGSDKKRVLCTECNKTFCDKGALKIHFSAVHLREMHRCTIAGCTMTFSSRRSRNRHSANPNPKLHTGGGGVMHVAKDDDDDDSDEASGSDEPLSSSVHADDCGGGALLLVDDGDSRSPLVVQVKMEDGAAADAYDCEQPRAAAADRSSSSSLLLPPVELASAAPQPPPPPPATKWDVPLHGSSKRKRLVPTRHVAAASRSNATGGDDDDDDDDYGDGDDAALVRLHRKRNGETAADSANASSTDDGAAHAGDDACQLSEPLANGRGEHEEAPCSPAVDASDSASQPSYGYGPATATTSPLQLSFPGGSPGRFGSGDAAACGGGGNAVDADGSVVDQSASPSAFAATATGVKNPRQCQACLKVFQNHFSAKIHYESVHLRLMHQCTIPGCTASFPSKRSRDRHSSNANLHRRQSEAARAPTATGGAAGGGSSAGGSKRSAAGASDDSSDGEYSAGSVPEAGGSSSRRAAGSSPQQLPRRAAVGADGAKATAGC